MYKTMLEDLIKKYTVIEIIKEIIGLRVTRDAALAAIRRDKRH